MPRPRKSTSGFSEEGARYEAKLPDRIDLQLGPGGRVVIPAVYRKAMQVKEGDRLMARVVDGELRLLTPEMAIRRAQKWVRETIPPEVDLVADLLEMRRQEVEDELKDG
jgi:bifunctional DNA-binding transcriptional regulator/antitoxin component of YhaV-PrlF toxin-antitoxin module